MDDEKRILVFSDAGGTGRSYHADLSARNQRKRVHYLLEPGWKADTAIQGLGRSNRTNQAQPPLFRPIATDVKAEKRFLSTIARRLDSLGAITAGSARPAAQGLFRPRTISKALMRGPRCGSSTACCSPARSRLLAAGDSRTATGLASDDRNGACAKSCRRSRPSSIACWRCRSRCRTAVRRVRGIARRARRRRDRVRRLRYRSRDADRRQSPVTERRPLHASGHRRRDPSAHASRRRDRNRPLALEAALALARDPRRRCWSMRSRAAPRLQTPAPSLMLDDGAVERRVRLSGRWSARPWAARRSRGRNGGKRRRIASPLPGRRSSRTSRTSPRAIST